MRFFIYFPPSYVITIAKLQSGSSYEKMRQQDDVLKMIQSKLTLKNLDCIYICMTHFGKSLERFSELSPHLSTKQQFYSKQNVQQNLRHKNVDFQCKSL